MLNIYKASAGSGKTFTLAREYIALLLGKHLENDKWELILKNFNRQRDILAVTFTNKATAEMKKRIIEQLSLLANDSIRSKSDYLPYLKELYKESEEKIGEASKQALHSILTNFKDFNVSTIDSFFQSVLRIFAHELELPVNFELQLNDLDVIKEAVADVLDTINGNGVFESTEFSQTDSQRLEKWLKKYLMMRMSEGKSFMLFNSTGKFFEDLVKHVTSLMDEDFRLNSDSILEYLNDSSKLIEFEDVLPKQKEKIIDEIKQESLIILHEIENINPPVTIYRHAIKSIQSFSLGNIPEKLGETLPKIANGDRKAINVGSIKNHENNPDILNLESRIREYCNIIVKRYEDLSLIHILQKFIYPFGIFGEVLRRLERYRIEKGSMLLSDTNDFLMKIIKDDDSPFIYERLGNKLNHFLLDEFQDTSKMQWKNLSPLLINSLATNQDNLIIGDEKQCIYRFRNSDPSLINTQVEEEMLSKRKKVVKKGINPAENRNWRSLTNIVKFNNSAFSALSRKLNVESFYSNVIQQPKKEEEGYVNVAFIQNEESDKKDSKDPGLERMLEHILRQLDSGYKPCDIAILVRKSSEGAEVVKFLLKEFNEIQWTNLVRPMVMSIEAFTLNDSDLIRFVISKFRTFSENFKSNDPKKLINYFQLRYHDKNDYVKSIIDALEKNDLEIDPILNEITSPLLNSNLVSLANSYIKEYLDNGNFDGDNNLIGETIFVSTFLDMLSEFVSLNGNNIKKFIEFWDEKGFDTKISIPENDNTIKVITIHKSKGLEFPCVHIPFADFELTQKGNLSNFHWFRLPNELFGPVTPPFFPIKLNKKLEKIEGLKNEYQVLQKDEILDNVNLLYVAFTRAIKELIVTCRLFKSKDKVLSEPDCVGEALYASLSDNQESFIINLKSHLNENDVIIIGQPTNNESYNKNKEGHFTTELVPEFHFNDNRLLEVTQPKVIEKLNWNDARERGEFFHLVLSRIIDRKDLEFALNKSAYEYSLSEKEISETREILRNAFLQVDSRNWFSGFKNVLTENTVVNIQHDQEELSRPDRIVWKENGEIDIIDYKTGETEEKKYIDQMHRYILSMQEMGFKNVKGFLWYIEKNKINLIN